MSSLRRCSLLLFLILSLLAATVISSPARRNTQPDPERFQALLSDIAEADIHELMHRFDSRFRDGVFHRDRTAIEAVHGEDPAMATELVKLARNKRQASNSTTTAAPPPPASTTSAPDTPGTTETPDAPATTTSPTANGGNAPAPTPTPTPTRTTASNVRSSVVPPPSPTGATAVSSTAGAVVYSKSNGQLTTVRSSTALVSFGLSTTTVRRTTTLPDGSVSTITSVAVVDAPYTTYSGAAAAEGTATSDPELQAGGAQTTTGGIPGLMAAIIGLLALGLGI